MRRQLPTFVRNNPIVVSILKIYTTVSVSLAFLRGVRALDNTPILNAVPDIIYWTLLVTGVIGVLSPLWMPWWASWEERRAFQEWQRSKGTIALADDLRTARALVTVINAIPYAEEVLDYSDNVLMQRRGSLYGYIHRLHGELGGIDYDLAERLGRGVDLNDDTLGPEQLRHLFGTYYSKIRDLNRELRVRL